MSCVTGEGAAVPLVAAAGVAGAEDEEAAAAAETAAVEAAARCGKWPSAQCESERGEVEEGGRTTGERGERGDLGPLGDGEAGE